MNASEVRIAASLDASIMQRWCKPQIISESLYLLCVLPVAEVLRILGGKLRIAAVLTINIKCFNMSRFNYRI